MRYFVLPKVLQTLSAALLLSGGCGGGTEFDPDGGSTSVDGDTGGREHDDGSTSGEPGAGDSDTDGHGEPSDSGVDPRDSGGNEGDGGSDGGGPPWPGGPAAVASPLAGSFGGLSATQFVPEGLDSWGPAPLVVALHGMGQSAAAFVADSEWAQLAGNHGFYVVAAQKPANGAFDWFSAGRERGAAEPEGLAAMVDAMAAEHTVDVDRVFVVGLSAGAFMAIAVCVGYPDVYAGCGSFAGGPYGCGMGCMGSPGNAVSTPMPDLWDDPSQRLPILFLVHGRNDGVVGFANLEGAAQQWTAAHGVDMTPDNDSLGLPSDIGGHAFDVHAAGSSPVVATLAVDRMGHGVPVAPGDGADQGGHTSMFAFDVGVYGAYEMVRFWGIAQF